MRFVKTLLLVIISVNVFGQVVPKPTKTKLLKGNFEVKKCKDIYCDSGRYATAKFINNELFNGKLNIVVANEVPSPYSILLGPFNKWRYDESYNLSITNDRIQIIGSPNAVYLGSRTLQQLLFHNPTKLKAQTIDDWPSFKWRGMHLDVCRHFFDVEFIKKYIDMLALHKMNTFHWHLTEDQGWRIEIKKYPKLTEIGSKRKETIVGKNFEPFKGDGKPYGGFYTQVEIKEVVAYAKERYITVIPEIEMPGHAVAALGAYPQFSCRQKPLETLTKWGISDDIYCSKDSTFEFLFDIMEEVLELFPSKYIHIGGDEAPKTRWKECAHCQANIKKHNLKDEHELQSYFIGRMDSFLTSKGRKMIGWDEILEGGLAENAAVMSWRGEKGGIAAAEQKHNVVMSPGSHCYFDHYQGYKRTEPLAIGGYTTLKKVYSYNPVPAKLEKRYEKYIMGAQGNVWTEYMETPEHVMYMALPRLCALSEVLWTGPGTSSYYDFTNRVVPHFDLLDSLAYDYSKALFNIYSMSFKSDNGLFVSLESDFPDYEIRYTKDGNEPNSNSLLFRKLIEIDRSMNLKARLFKKGKAFGNIYSREYKYHLALGKKVELKTKPSEHYNTGGAQTLVNGAVGSLPWSGNEWLGWKNGEPLVAIIDFGKEVDISKVKVSFLEARESWIHLPETVQCAAVNSMDDFDRVKKLEILTIDNKDSILWSNNNLNIKTRFLLVKALPTEIIPEGNPGSGNQPWLFCSEIIVE